MDNNLINKKDNNKDNNKDIDYNQKANEFEEVLNSLPEQKRELIERTFIGLMAQGNESPEAILAKNFTPDTLRQQLDNLSQQDKFVYKDRQFYKLFVIIIILIVSILFIVIIRMLSERIKDLL